VSAEQDVGPSAGGFFARLPRERIPEILAGFIGGGWLILEFVHFMDFAPATRIILSK